MIPISSRPMPRVRIVAVGFHGLRELLEEAVPMYADAAEIIVLDKIYDDAVQGIAVLRMSTTLDAVVAAGSNGHYLREHLDVPVVLVKPDGFDLFQGLARAANRSRRVAVVTYGATPPEVAAFNERYQLGVALRAYKNEAEAESVVRDLANEGIDSVVAPGLVVDLARESGMDGVLLYSQVAVREAMTAAIEIARVARQEMARREKLNTILAQLKDGVVAVDLEERIELVNPAMEALIGQPAEQLLGQRLSVVQPELGLARTLRTGLSEVEQVQEVAGRASVVTRLPIYEQGRSAGAVLVCQDPVAIQRMDRDLRSRGRTHQRHAKYGLANLVGDSAAIRKVKRHARKSARSNATVLIVGESGTGKELLAQGIHNASPRRAQPFVAVNCAAFPETLLESELFGYVEGAFTGSMRGGKPGLFEAAHTGTIFLDEIGEMPLSLQTRLLRVLQEREVLRVGSTMPTPVDVRVIAATNRDLAEEVRSGQFRQDLYYRLNILALRLPPLRERHGDLPLLARHLAEKLARRLNSPTVVVDDLVDALVQVGRSYIWPGNIRELENVIERILVLRESERPGDKAQEGGASKLNGQMAIDALRELAPELFDAAEVKQVEGLPIGDVDSVSFDSPDVLHRATATLERRKLLAALEQCGGNREQAARLLGVSRTTLWRRLREHQIT